MSTCGIINELESCAGLTNIRGIELRPLDRPHDVSRFCIPEHPSGN